MGGGVSEEDYIDAVIGGCIEIGTLGCVGDGVPDFIHQAGYAAIKSNNGAGIPFIKPWEDKEWKEKLEKALETGTDIIGMDVDAAGGVSCYCHHRRSAPISRWWNSKCRGCCIKST